MWLDPLLERGSVSRSTPPLARRRVLASSRFGRRNGCGSQTRAPERIGNGGWRGAGNGFMVVRMKPSPAAERERMVREQIADSVHGAIGKRVQVAMECVPRHEFVPKEISDLAHDDRPLPIGYGQTISQPFIVGFMTELLALQPTDRVLEIGTGSGYQAAILAELVAEVYSIEIVPALAQRAETVLRRLGYANIHTRLGDGHQGWPEAAPFDAIIVTCAPNEVPQPLVEQLKDGGRMIIPVGVDEAQDLVLLRQQGGELRQAKILPVRFVPMTGGMADGGMID